MKYILIAIALLAGLICGTGCDLLTNIDGWNLSACEEEWSVCTNLFFDNQTKILGGQTAIEATLDWWNSE